MMTRSPRRSRAERRKAIAVDVDRQDLGLLFRPAGGQQEGVKTLNVHSVIRSIGQDVPADKRQADVAELLPARRARHPPLWSCDGGTDCRPTLKSIMENAVPRQVLNTIITQQRPVDQPRVPAVPSSRSPCPLGGRATRTTERDHRCRQDPRPEHQGLDHGLGPAVALRSIQASPNPSSVCPMMRREEHEHQRQPEASSRNRSVNAST